MKKLIALILFPFLFMPFGARANDNFSVEIEALTLVMEQYKEDTESSVELDIEDRKSLLAEYKEWIINDIKFEEIMMLPYEAYTDKLDSNYLDDLL